MRIAEAKIKEAILNPDRDIHQTATHYFAKSFSDDPTIMPLVVKAVETFGPSVAGWLVSESRHLHQTDETIAWVIDQLNDPKNDKHSGYSFHLATILQEADILLVLRNESAIQAARNVMPAVRDAIKERVEMSTWDADTCWRRLEEVCEDGKDKYAVSQFNWDHATRIVAALARFGTECEQSVHDLLTQTVDDYDNNPMGWLEPLVVRLAGQVRLGSAIPLLIAKLRSDGGDILNEECAEAFTRIGTDAVVEAIAAVYPDAPCHFRIYAAGAMGGIHSDLVVARGRELLRRDTDRASRIRLAQSLVLQFDPVTIDDVRQLLVGQKLDFDLRSLRNNLVTACTIMGETFPEYDQWRADRQAEQEEHSRRVAELKDDPDALFRYELDKLAGKKLTHLLATGKTSPAPQQPRLAARSAEDKKVGRNDRCPCGSGKKYKQCCLRKRVG